LTQLATAASFQTEESIREAARNFLLMTGAAASADTTIDVGALDPRARLPLCVAPLQVQYASAAGNSQHLLLNIRCPESTSAWSIYVPATLHSRQSVAVLARPVPLNGTLQAGDIRMEIRDTAALGGGYFTDAEQLVGQVVGLQLVPGLPIPQNAVKAPLAVRRGQTVTLLADGSNVQVAMHGQALADAALGQSLQVKNLSSKRVVEGTVTAPGIVSVPF
jgi:flagella basal body P-ring formation protein FlgA